MGNAEDVVESPDPERRKLLAGATAAAGGLALSGAGAPFLASLAPSERAKASGAPAPTNLVVPPYRFESDSRIAVGLDPGAAA